MKVLRTCGVILKKNMATNKINKFRTKDIYKFNRALEEDANRFFRGGSFVENKCPVCVCQNNEYVHRLFGFYIVRCEKCGFVYFFPRPTIGEQKKFYEFGKSSCIWQDILRKTFYKRKENYIENTIPIIKPYLDRATKLVDVGSGHGIWLDAVGDSFPFIDLYGIEPFKSSKTNKKYIEINSFLEDIREYNGFFDCCTLMSVLEHVIDPVVFLRCCNEILKTDGFLFLTVPNFDGFDFLALDINDRNWVFPQHINFFNMDVINKCVVSAGFRVVDSGSFGKFDVEIVKEAIKNKKTIENDFITTLLGKDEKILNNFQQFLITNNLSGQIYIIGQKI